MIKIQINSHLFSIAVILFSFLNIFAQSNPVSKVWVADNGDGTKDAMCNFSFSTDGKNFQNIGEVFKAREGKWIGAKVGLFFSRQAKFNDAGTADVDWLRFEK